MKKRLTKIIVTTISCAMLATLFATTAFAYDRQEAVEISGGTVVGVYAGTQNSNDQGNYLQDPGDYEKYNIYSTAGKEISTSNITSSTNFEKTFAEGAGLVGGGGVEGVSWNGSTLTLDNVEGTVITIAGPSINPFKVNTYNDKLNPVISSGVGANELSWANNLTYYKQFDLFAFAGEEAGAPHTKDNTAKQDTVYIELAGESKFANLRITGNVKVVFKGSGTITFDAASKDWNYDDYSDPEFDHLCDKSPYAISSELSIGYKGKLSGKVEAVPMENERMKEIVTEWYKYELPEIVLEGGLDISEGGEVFNSCRVANTFGFTYAGNGELGEPVADAAPLENKSTIVVGAQKYNMSYDADRTTFLLEVGVKQGRDMVYSYYDITPDVEAWKPYASFIGEDRVPAEKVVISGK